MDDGQGYDYGAWLQNPVATFECAVDAVRWMVGHGMDLLWWLRR